MRSFPKGKTSLLTRGVYRHEARLELRQCICKKDPGFSRDHTQNNPFFMGSMIVNEIVVGGEKCTLKY